MLDNAPDGIPNGHLMAKAARKRSVDLAAVKGQAAAPARRRSPDPAALPPDDSVAIGFHLRRERRLKKLLLKDVADATGCRSV